MKMKKIYGIFVLILAIVLVIPFTAFNVNKDQSEINPPDLQQADKNHINSAAELVNSKTAFVFSTFNLFKRSSKPNSSALNSFVSGATTLNINKVTLRNNNTAKPELISLVIPGNGGKETELELVKVNIFSDDLKVRTLGTDGAHYINYTPGLYYRGIVKGDNSSIVSLSIFENNVMGIISTDNGNYVLGSVKNEQKQLTDEYVFYNDQDIKNKPGFECGSGDSYNRFYRDPVSNVLPKDNGRNTTSPVDIYFVCDYQMYLDGGSNTNNVVNFVTGAFVHVKTLYLNEQLTVNISSIDVYTTPDPYVNMSQSDVILQEFGLRTQNNFTGDLAHLLSTGHGQQLGEIAWINVLCQSYEPSSQSGRYAFSNIEGTYSPYPI